MIGRYLGVPRILDGTLPEHFLTFGEEDVEAELIGNYLQTTRININVRQVFPRGFDPWEQGVLEAISDARIASDPNV